LRRLNRLRRVGGNASKPEAGSDGGFSNTE
jgi:hypothetical protein